MALTSDSIPLPIAEMPTAWYNALPDLPTPLEPPLNPATRQPIGPEALAAIFPMTLIEQEVSSAPWIAIPTEVLDVLSIWRPTPLIRATRWEKAIETPARIFYKYEGTSPAGSHKPNTAVAQAFYNKKAGIKRLATETGAGQWGSALAFACCKFGLACTVYMVKISYEQKPYRRSLMHVWGAEVYPSPTDRTNAGRSILAKDPECLGSLGIAISEAVEDAATKPDVNYSLGSVLNHVLLHQTIVGLETKKQLKSVGLAPNVMIGCCGGGSNFGGLILPFLPDRLNGNPIRFLAAEPKACPSMTRGKFDYDFGDTVGMTPLLKMYTLGHEFVPPGIHAGGLRYHGMAPIISRLVADKIVEPVACYQNDVFSSSVEFARTEGIVPAPESGHAVKVARDEALRCKRDKKAETIVFELSGHGFFDMGAYDAYFAGKLEDIEHEPGE
jgi:tryptophan synthase beta chain